MHNHPTTPALARPFPPKVSVAEFADKTVAVDITFSQALVQWPYLDDASFVDTVSAIFHPPQVTGSL